MKLGYVAIGLVMALMVLLVSACEVDFVDSIQPLELATAPPQAFQEFAVAQDQTLSSIQSDSSDQPVIEGLVLVPPTFGLDLAASVIPLAGVGALGLMLATALTFARLDLVKAENVCIGAIVAGLLGFFALVPFDYAAAVSAAALGTTGPVGVALDLFIILPLELIVINLHIGFISLAFHARNRSCADLDPKEYFLPPWGFGT